MRELLELARKPVVATTPRATVRELAELLMKEKIGAAVVLEDGALVGIVSERDVVRRAVAQRRDPDTTRVSEIMTADVRVTRAGMKIHEALEIMHAGHLRHLPLVADDGSVVGMLSIRDLLRWRVGELDLKNKDLLGFICADGPGG